MLAKTYVSLSVLLGQNARETLGRWSSLNGAKFSLVGFNGLIML